MKESITKFDLESAFKALDEIEIPKVGKVRANKPALTEIFSRKSKFDLLFEEYYDIGSSEGLEDAKEAREAEVAQAKLARIEKIVDLDAESAEDLLTSYVGKLIVQCPQCMTLFYRNPEDVVASEEDPTTVNVNEVCQHCGNESGYSLIGKVGEAEPEVEETPAIEEDDLDLNLDNDGGVEEESEEAPVDDLNFDDELEELDLDIEEEPVEEEEEKKEESFVTHEGEALVEELADDKELDAKLEAHSEYIEYLRTAIAQEEEKLEKATNEQVKVAIQRNIDAFKSDLENALPEAVKAEIEVEEIAEEPIEEVEALEAEVESEVEAEPEVTEEALTTEAESTLTEAFHEETDTDVSDAEFEQLMNSSEFKKPISDTAVRAMLAMEKEEKKEESLKESSATIVEHTLVFAVTADVQNMDLTKAVCSAVNKLNVKCISAKKLNSKYHITVEGTDEDLTKAKIAIENCGFFKSWLKETEESLDVIFNDVEELQESALESMISDSLVEMYGNVAGFRLKECSYEDKKFMVEGIIHFTSGNTRKTTYTFNEALFESDKITLRGLNEKLGNDKQFFITGYTENKTFITESFKTAKN